MRTGKAIMISEAHTNWGVRVKSKTIILALLALTLAPALCHAGINKTGGGFEIMSDTISKAGMAPASGGAMTLYHTVGQQAGNGSSSGGTYSLNAGFMGVVDETPPTMSFSSPDASTSNSGSVAVSGTVFDENNSTWTLSYGPGTSPTLWKQIGGGSANTVSATLAAWDASTLWGTYTLKITASDSRGNTSSLARTVGIWNSDTFSATIPADQWTFVSLPGIPLNQDPRSFLGNSRYEVQRWDPTLTPDEKGLCYCVNFSVTAGDGFWIKPYKTPITYSVETWVPDTTSNYEKRLEAGWNQIGMPYDRAATWNLFEFKRDGDASAVSLNTAIANGWLDSKFYSYSNSGYTANDAAQSLQPFVGYFVYALSAGTLILNPGAGMPGGLARIIRPVYDWRMQIVAETDEARDAENFVGEMQGASETFGKEDSGEPPTIEPYVSAYVERPEWNRGSGRFTADIRGSQDAADPQGNTWNLIVETDKPGKAVTLSLPDASSLPDNYQIHIRDNATGAEFDPRSMPPYSFTTGSDNRRSFTITAKRTAASDTSATRMATVFQPGWTLFSVPLETTETDVRDQLGAALGKMQVYQYFNRRIFDQNSIDRVDIQAGIGYWVYTNDPVDAEFRGREIAPGQAVEVPLAAGWNMIGNPFNSEIPFADNISVSKDGEAAIPLSQAVAAGWILGLYGYNADTSGYEELEQGAAMAPWKGYAIKALVPCTLLISR